MSRTLPRRTRARVRTASARACGWAARARIRAATALARSREQADDRGATAIEWAIFAILALTIAGLVAAAITAAINNRLPGIQ